jgi:uncharacterized protein
MKVREFKPRQLDVQAFAEAGATLSGDEPAARFERLMESRHPDTPAEMVPAVHWSVRGEQLATRGGKPETWLHLSGRACLPMTCQRCLEAVDEPLQVDRRFLFVADEAQAAALDADAEDDVLVLSRRFDLFELLEDELLMAAPLVPRHETCPVTLPDRVGEDTDPMDDAPAEDTTRPNPFAALAALRRGGDDHGNGGPESA